MAFNPLITGFLSQGTAASRPTAPVEDTNTLTFYYATDTTILSYYDWNAAAWKTLSAGSPTAEVLITETTTSGSQASVTFSSIATSYRDLRVVVRGRGDTSATNVVVQLQFNGDTAANYSSQINSAGTTNTNPFINSTSLNAGAITAATSPTNTAGMMNVLIPDYRGTTFTKAVCGPSMDIKVNSSGNLDSYLLSGYWNSTAAINSVKVQLSAGNFVNNSVVSLYGRY